jgi:hypothetical protein
MDWGGRVILLAVEETDKHLLVEVLLLASK